MKRKVIDIVLMILWIIVLITSIVINYVSITTCIVMWAYIFRYMLKITIADFKQIHNKEKSKMSLEEAKQWYDDTGKYRYCVTVEDIPYSLHETIENGYKSCIDIYYWCYKETRIIDLETMEKYIPNIGIGMVADLKKYGIEI